MVGLTNRMARIGRFWPSYGSRVIRVSSAAIRSLSNITRLVPATGSTSWNFLPAAVVYSYQNRSEPWIQRGVTVVEWTSRLIRIGAKRAPSR